MAIDTIQSYIEKINVAHVKDDERGEWRMDGEITFAVESSPDPDLNVSVTLRFLRARSPLEAKRQTLMNLQAIAGQLSELASRELQAVNRRMASQR